MNDDPPILDCLIVGAGPAGLTAAIYLARFHLRIEVVDAGASRMALIPRTRNHAGYPGGISGKALLALMREQAGEYGIVVADARVEGLVREDGHFTACAAGQIWRAHTVLLASGVVNNRPAMAADDHARALAKGLLRYCPVCDGFEATDQRIGVIGTGQRGKGEALFLRMFSRDVTLIAPASHDLSPEDRAELQACGITLVEGPCQPLHFGAASVMVHAARTCEFDTLYPALGSVIRSELAVQLGAATSDEGCLVADAHQRTSVPGLYAAGDVTKGLDQISHAMGEAGVAATTIRNDLAQNAPLLRA